ncbi:uncharacterized protein LOC130998508 [Salvia miltiorrhiza]|uniref:uncharacterized protein LOC130998508 n=1 Tax=Salvia miltiorrhiza TaxID=226208 RepID=UPI0025AC4826|nr:uncharacterized protein LOC130998508 [Salvia miltiorrhiza]
MVAQSVTNEEIARYWKQRHMLEEDHLFAAIKAAARIRARNLSEADYLQFQEALTEEDDKFGKKNKMSKVERRVGVKDWWTKSKYAYLNQPALKPVDFHLRQYSLTFKSASLLKFISPPTS